MEFLKSGKAIDVHNTIKGTSHPEELRNLNESISSKLMKLNSEAIQNQ